MFLPYNPGNIKKKSSAAVLKSTLLATDRESLARKPGTEDVGSSREKRAAFKKSDPVLSGISRQKMSDVLSVCFPGNRIYRLTGHYQGCFKRKLVSERVRYLSGTQRGGTLRQPVRRYDVAIVPLSDKCR